MDWIETKLYRHLRNKYY